MTVNDLYIIVGEQAIKIRQLEQSLNDLTNEYNKILALQPQDTTPENPDRE